MSKPTLDDAIRAYVSLRDELDTLRKAHKEVEAGVKLRMDKFEAFFLNYLNQVGGTHLATEHGTVYKSTKSSATVSDWERCLDFIRANEMWHALDRRVNKTAVLEYMEEQGSPFPGVNYTAYESVNVRRS